MIVGRTTLWIGKGNSILFIKTDQTFIKFSYLIMNFKMNTKPFENRFFKGKICTDCLCSEDLDAPESEVSHNQAPCLLARIYGNSLDANIDPIDFLQPVCEVMQRPLRVFLHPFVELENVLVVESSWAVSSRSWLGTVVFCKNEWLNELCYSERFRTSYRLQTPSWRKLSSPM